MPSLLGSLSIGIVTCLVASDGAKSVVEEGATLNAAELPPLESSSLEEDTNALRSSSEMTQCQIRRWPNR